MHALYTDLVLNEDELKKPYRFIFDYTPAFPGSLDWPREDEVFDLMHVHTRVDGMSIPVDRETYADAFAWFFSPEGLQAAAAAMDDWAFRKALTEQGQTLWLAQESRAA